jgi:predicted metal-dependent peptidase
MKTIEKAIKSLLDTNPFYACFFLNSKVEYDTHKVETAGAAMTSRGPLLIFNTKFLSTMTPSEVGAIVEHEVLHLLFSHTTAHSEDKTLVTNIANIAMDASINQYITGLPEGCITIEGLNKVHGLSLLNEQTWEYYYTHLMNKRDELEGQNSFDDHGIEVGEGESPGSPGEQKAALRTAVDKAMKASAGNAPQAVLRAFDSLKESCKVPWQQVLSNFVARSISCTSKNTRNKINRRFGLDQPGKKKKRELVLGVCADSSGSVSDESYLQFLTEIARISSLCSITYLVDADCVVQNVTVIKKGMEVKRERKGNGGTAYQPAIDECMKRKCDAIIYFGDFDCADTPKNPGIPFLWVGVGNSKKPGDFGGEIRL